MKHEKNLENNWRLTEYHASSKLGLIVYVLGFSNYYYTFSKIDLKLYKNWKIKRSRRCMILEGFYHW